MSMVDSIARRLTDAYGTCKACGQRIRVTADESHLTTDVVLTARCHGTVERYSISGVSLLARDPEKTFAPVVAWFKNLFAADCNPDVMELLRYNRGEVPSTP